MSCEYYKIGSHSHKAVILSQEYVCDNLLSNTSLDYSVNDSKIKAK